MVEFASFSIDSNSTRNKKSITMQIQAAADTEKTKTGCGRPDEMKKHD